MEEQFDLIDYICVSQCIRRGVSRKAEDELRRNRISHFHILYIALLYKSEGGLTLSELSTYAGMDRANATRAVADLEHLGFVRRERHKEGCKKYKIVLTETGTEIGGQTIAFMREKARALVSGLTDKEARTFFSLIKKQAAYLRANKEQI